MRLIIWRSAAPAGLRRRSCASRQARARYRLLPGRWGYPLPLDGRYLALPESRGTLKDVGPLPDTRADKNASAGSAAGRVNALGWPPARPVCEPALLSARKLRSARAPFASPRVALRQRFLGGAFAAAADLFNRRSWMVRHAPLPRFAARFELHRLYVGATSFCRVRSDRGTLIRVLVPASPASPLRRMPRGDSGR